MGSMDGYDGNDEGRNYYPDNILAPPRSDRLVASGGWSTPQYYTYPAISRGGIKYPLSAEAQRRQSKENTVTTPRQCKQEELDRLKAKRTRLEAKMDKTEIQIDTLSAELKRLERPAPPLEQYQWRIQVRYQPDGKSYTYLVLRSAGMFFTTGSGAVGKFNSWEDFLGWLDTAHSYSPMFPLTSSTLEVPPLRGKGL